MPGGAGGKEVGRIAIRVVPNLDDFREKLRAELQGIPDSEVKVDADTSAAKEKIDAVSKDTEAKVRVEADTAGASEKIDAVARTRTAKIKVDVDKVGLNPEVVQRFTNNIKRELEKGQANLNQIRLNPEIVGGRFLEQLKLRQLEAQINLKPHLDQTGIEEMRARLRHENFTAKVKLDADMSKLHLAAAKAEAAIGKIPLGGRSNLLGPPGGGGGGFGSAAGGFGGAGKLAMLGDQTFWIAGAVLALLAPALAMLATSLASLPALLSAVALPIGAIVLGVGGFKKALENVGLMGEDKKGKAKPGVELKKLQEDVSAEFERGLTPIFRELLGLLPQVREGFVGIARGIVADIQGLSDAFTKGNGPAMIQNIFRNVGEMLNQAAPGMNSFATAILGLASKVSDHLPGLARFFSEWGSKFTGWVDKISKDGTLDKAVSGMKPVMDSVMNFFAQMMDAGIKLMADPAMAQNIKTVLDGITNFIVQALPTLNQVFQTLASLIHDLGLDGPTKPIGKPGAPGQPGGAPWMPLEPAAPGSGGKFQWAAPEPKVQVPYDKQGFLDQLETDPLRKLKEMFKGGGADHPLGKLGDGIGDGVKNLWNRVTKNAPDAGKGLMQPVEAGANWMDKNVGAPVGNFFTGNNQWEKSLVEGAKNVPQQIGQALEPLDQIVGQTMDKVAKAAETAWDSFKRSAAESAKAVIDEISKLPGQIESALGNLAGIGLRAGKAMLDGLLNGMKDAWHGVQDFVGGIAGWIADHKGPLDYDRTVLQPNGQALMAGLGDGIETGLQGVLDRARRIAGEVQGAMQGGFSPGSRSGAAQAAVEQAESMVGQSYVSGISDCSGAISQVYSAMTGKKTHFTTMADFAALGFKPGFKQGALNIGVTPLPGQSGHMAATLPNGQNFESGGRLGGGPKVGGGAAGAQDSQFSQHWYYGGGGAVAGGADVSGMQGEIKQSLQELDVERDKLQAQRDALPKGKESKEQRDSLSEQLKQIKMARDALVTERDELKLGASQLGAGDAGGKGTDSMTEAAQMITKGLASSIDLAKNFVMANVQQMESDLGIGGKGAIPTIANIGLGWAQGELNNMINADFGLGTKGPKKSQGANDVHIHVNSVDEAMQAKQTVDNRKALQWTER